LLSDIVMPGIDGLELAARIRDERPTTPALLISGKTAAELVQGNALFDFLAKPFVPAQLKAKIEGILNRMAAEPGRAATEEI
jgi:DNA-binding response OmpR family regulator